MIKSYLARGIAVGFYMRLVPKDPFYFYRGGDVLHRECKPYKVNHAVVCVGYGKKDGKDVWVIRNSWGPRWGDHGYWFAEIGKDSYCVEHHAYAIIPRGMDLAGNVTALPALTADDGVERGESWELDEDEVLGAGDYVRMGVRWSVVFGVVLGVCVLALSAWGTARLFRKYRQPLLGADEESYRASQM